MGMFDNPVADIKRVTKKAAGNLSLDKLKGMATAKGVGQIGQNLVMGQTGYTLAPFAYLGGLQQGGWEAGVENGSESLQNGDAYYTDPHKRKMVALTAAEVALVAATAGIGAGAVAGSSAAYSSAGLAGGYTAGGTLVGAGTLAGITAGGAATAASQIHKDGIPTGPDASDGLREAQAKAEAETKTRIGQIRAVYGEGDSFDAQANRAGIDRYLSQIAGEDQAQATAEVGDLYQQDVRAAQDDMATRGLSGGSADLEARRKILTNFVANRQKVVNATRSATDQARVGFQKERQALEANIAKGTKADPTWGVTAATRQGQLKSSWQDAWNQSVGGLIQGAGYGVSSAIDNGDWDPGADPAYAKNNMQYRNS